MIGLDRAALRSWTGLVRTFPWTTLLLAVMLGITAGLAVAETDRERHFRDALEVDLPGDPCLTHGTLLTRTVHWLGRKTVAPDVRVRVELHGGLVSFTLERAGEPVARRTFDVLPDHCSAKSDAVALAIAIAIDPDVLARAAEAAAGADAGADAAPGDAALGDAGWNTDAGPATLALSDAGSGAGAVADASAAAATEDDGETTGAPGVLRPGASAGGFLQFDGVPGLAGGAMVAAELGVGERGLLRLRGLLTSEVSPRLGAGQVGMRLVLSEAGGCFIQEVGKMGLGACLGLGVGALLARGKGFETNLRTTRPLLAGLGEILVLFPSTGRFGLQWGMMGLTPLGRPGVNVKSTTGVVLDRRKSPKFGLFFSLSVFARKP